ncbi:glycosyltransferase [Pseudomonas sp. NPDC090233]|uniref:glycosyltransferase n=1 Tax=Pseudomonas sp. NPDC090233 TaxID=3364479 RepID=UPI00383A874D
MLTATVVVSCYNQENYIEECLDSILGQEINFPCEVIVSDDCSPDNTQAVIRRYAEAHPGRLTLMLREKNVGAALNYHGVHAMAKGDIVFHFDGDDVMLPGKLQEQYDLFAAHADVNIVFHKAIYFSDDGSYQSETVYPGANAPYHTFFDLHQLARWGATCVHSSYAYRRSSRQAKIEREFMEWFFAMDSLIRGGRGVYIDKALVRYRSNPGNGSYLSTVNGRKKSYTIFFGDLYEYFSAYPWLRSDLYANFLITVLAMLRSTKTLTMKNFKFMLANILYFRPSKFLETARVRKMVGPAEKNR